MERAEQGNSHAEQGEHMACGDFGSLLLSEWLGGRAGSLVDVIREAECVAEECSIVFRKRASFPHS